MQRLFILALSLFNHRNPAHPHRVKVAVRAMDAREAAEFAFEVSNNPQFDWAWSELAPGVRSFSVGDVVSVSDGEEITHHLCMNMGWREISEEVAEQLMRRSFDDLCEIEALVGAKMLHTR